MKKDRFRAKIERHIRQAVPVTPRRAPTRGQIETPKVDQIETPKAELAPLVFTTCINEGFIPGAEGLIKSIRRFHPTSDIIVFVEDEYPEFNDFAAKHQAQIEYFKNISEWAVPLVYDEKSRNNSNHFYHKDFKIMPDMPHPDHHLDRAPGFGIHHLHPMNVKAYCTGFCVCVKNYKQIVHIDSDAFLLANIDDMFARHPEQDTVICWEDNGDFTEHLEIFGIAKPPNYEPRDYGMNAGIVFYVNGPNLKEMMREFMFFIDSCYHYTVVSPNGDQGVLRNMIAKYDILKRINLHRYERTNWNPTWQAADELTLVEGKWINGKNKEQQFMWHGAGASKIWTRNYQSSGVNDAWKWLGGRYL